MGTIFSEKAVAGVSGGSEIRAMFERGARMAADFGPENVYDFTLGNPDPEADPKVTASIHKYAEQPGIHKYMANAGYRDVRDTVAAYETGDKGVDFTGDRILMVAGAAAGLNVVFKSILNPGENVLTVAPYFVEYRSYVSNHGGTLRPVPAEDGTFQPDVEALLAAVDENTKAVLLNSPNNPTGVVFAEERLRALADGLSEAEERIGHPVFVISDEPYAKIIYDGVRVPSVPAIFPHSIIVTSFSKSLALPGERIGYIAVGPEVPEAETLMQCMILCARTLGFVNAPSLFQRVIADNLDLATGVESYRERRDRLLEIINKAGFCCVKPEGAFYLFPKSPVEDDRAFCEAALKHHILAVSGSGFGYPGYFRLAYCVSMETIENSEKAWMELGKEFRLI